MHIYIWICICAGDFSFFLSFFFKTKWHVTLFLFTYCFLACSLGINNPVPDGRSSELLYLPTYLMQDNS